ncbi:hypothetical protein [Acetobacter ghanensis]|uniref:Uncharacterized protein n=1 Tax=Acetobacter ghanensis TaxID=431306 RepID=A0A0U5F1Q0_9PROT|nr:hypothetical protein [Acetobacter ghanensis]NHO39980.1 hypothetical protein [Acetobacter ghanensis]GBQ48353.1 hypothetical protein AA18895_1318 [Acetobacter ghanensis DSM 18895]CEF53923.1 hypothetical protein AGA_484 [Acetobacter ghanensis]
MAWKKATFVSLWLAALSLAICSTFIFVTCGLKFSVFHAGMAVHWQDFTDNSALSHFLWQSLPESEHWSDYALSLPGLVASAAFVSSIVLGSYAALQLEELNHGIQADRQADIRRWESLLVGQVQDAHQPSLFAANNVVDVHYTTVAKQA